MSSQTSKTLLHTSLLVIMGAMWGLQFAMLKLAAGDGIDEIAILTFSLIFLSIFFTAVALFLRKRFFPSLSNIVYFCIGSFLGYIAPLGAVLYISQNLTTGMITLIASLTPVVTVAITLVIRSEIVSRTKIIGMALGLVACALVLWPELGDWENSQLWWLTIALIMPLSYGIDGIYIARYWPVELDSLQVVAGETITAALMMMPFYFLFSEPVSFTPVGSPGQWGIFWFSIAGVVEVLLFFYLIRNAGPVLVSFGSVISLFAGIAWGIALFGEQHPAIVWLAVLLLAMALVFVVIGSREPAHEHPRESA